MTPVMESIAGWAAPRMDRQGNIALGYSVVNGVDVYPGIRYTGRLATDPIGQMTLGEGDDSQWLGHPADDQQSLG